MEREPRLMDQEEDETEESETEVPAEPEGEIPTDVSARATNMDPYSYMAAKRGDTDFVEQLNAVEIYKCATLDIVMRSDPPLMDPEEDETEGSETEVPTEPGEIPTVVSARATNMDPDLYMAAKRGDTDFIKQLKAKDIEQNPVFSQRTPKLNSVLHIAASLGHSQLVKAILECDRELWKKKNSAGELAFHVATSCGHLSTLKKLVCVSGSEFLGRHNKDWNTPLHLALINKYREVDLVWKTKYSEIADYLVETNPLVSYFPNKEHKSPLHKAAEAGDAEMVKLMIERADGINMGTVDGERIVLNQFMQLAYLALRCAGVSHASCPSTTMGHLPSTKPGGQSSMDRDNETITENSQSSKPWPWEAPNMDNYKDRVNTLVLVATLVATVTFAAGFTVPGGNDDSEPHKGMAKFLQHHLFQAFIISNSIAMYSSVTVVVALISSGHN